MRILRGNESPLRTQTWKTAFKKGKQISSQYEEDVSHLQFIPNKQTTIPAVSLVFVILLSLPRTVCVLSLLQRPVWPCQCPGMTKGSSVQLAGSVRVRGQEPGRPDFGVLPDPSFWKPQVYTPHVACRLGPWVGKISWRRKWQATLVFLPGESHGHRSLVGYRPWGCKELATELDMTHTHITIPLTRQLMNHRSFPQFWRLRGWARAAVGTITPHLSPTECSGLNACAPFAPDGYAEILFLSVMVLDSEALGRWLWLSEAMKLEPMVGFMLLHELGDSFHCLCCPPCEHRATSLQFAAWRRALTSTPPHWHPNLRLSSSKTVGNSCGLQVTWCMVFWCVCVSCPTLWDPMDYNPPGSLVHGILQARILEWVAISFFRGSSPPRDQTCSSCSSCIGRRVLSHWATWEALRYSGTTVWTD